MDTIVDALTYKRNAVISVVQYIILISVLTGSIVVAGRGAVIVACIGIILQAVVWFYTPAVGISLIYCLLLGYMTTTRRRIHNIFPEWIVWLVVFIIANIASAVVVDSIRDTLIAHTIAYIIGVLIGVTERSDSV